MNNGNNSANINTEGENIPGDAETSRKEAVSKKPSFAKKLVLSIVFGIIFVFSSALVALCIWYSNTFNISFNDLLFTVISPIEGTGSSTVSDIVRACVPTAAVACVLYTAAVILIWQNTRIKLILRRAGMGLCALTLCASIVFALVSFRIPQYLAIKGGTSELYETEYVDPNSVAITDKDGNARNLIYIYLESMETSYASTDVGGSQEGVNYMPYMTELANANISFSDCDGLGGFRSITGTGWTMGALMGTTSGVPFALSVFGDESHNSQGKDGTFVNGLATIGDVLAEKGYKQEFLCGSKASFGGRDTYFRVHGNYEIYDLYTAREEGAIASDYHNGFWGFEDKILYEIAKDEILELSRGDAPFNFTMLTVDPHHVGGYLCSECGDDYENKLANVIKCADDLLEDFIGWCVEQDFFEDTTIVIVGDHPRMDTQLVKGLDYYDRTMYNCIINAVPQITDEKQMQNRVFTSLDIFPTTLAAMGFEIEGERLGLGTNLFSVVPTLCEKKGGKAGYEWLDAEVQKHSNYYKEEFVESGK